MAQFVTYKTFYFDEVHARCPEDSRHCVVIVKYTPNLQDDSDANFNEHAGRMISLERDCDKVRNYESEK